MKQEADTDLDKIKIENKRSIQKEFDRKELSQ